MARVYSCSFLYKLFYEIKIDALIKGYYLYREIWTPQKHDILYCMNNYRSEALDIHKHAVGTCTDDSLVGHVPIELSRIISYLLQESETSEVKVTMNGKRKSWQYKE